MDLSLLLRAIVTQRLAKTVSGGRTAILEIMLNVDKIKRLIAQGDFIEIPEQIKKYYLTGNGSRTFGDSLFEAIEKGVVSLEEAKNVDIDEFAKLKVRLESTGTQSKETSIEQRLNSDMTLSEVEKANEQNNEDQ
jgi:twitching motility protein PilU